MIRDFMHSIAKNHEHFNFLTNNCAVVTGRALDYASVMAQIGPFELPITELMDQEPAKDYADLKSLGFPLWPK
jgi:hypothetical protein